MAKASPTANEILGRRGETICCPSCGYMGEVPRMDIMPGEPRSAIQAWVDSVVGRRSEAFDKLRPELQRLIVGLLDQLSTFAEREWVDLGDVGFDMIRWVRTGEIVIDLSYRGRRISPKPY